MKKIALSILLLFPCLMVNSQSVTRTISVDGQNRSFRLYVPAMYNGNTAVPLIFNFHGYTSNAQEQEFYGDFRPIADTANFILVHPQGLDIGGGLGWNSFAGTSSTNYDYRFVDEMIISLSAEFNINANRIYSTGLSNGGFLSYDLACFMSDKFAAIASVAGSMINSHKTVCNPNRNVPVLQIHGTADQTVSYNGAGGILASVHIDSLHAFWKGLNNCTQTTTVAFPNVNTSDNTTAQHFIASGTTFNSSAELIKIQSGGHTWPGSAFPSVGQNTCQDFSASKEIWYFFSQHELNEPSANTNELEKSAFEMFPNPSNTILFLNAPEATKIEIFDVHQSLVLSQNLNQGKNEISLLDFTSGVYFVRISNKIKKLIVTN